MGARKTKTESGSGLRNAGKRGKANTLPNGWSVSFLKDETTKAHFIEITFPTRGRESDSIQIGAEERAEDLKVVRQLASRNADLPEKRAEQKALVQAVVASAPTNPVVLTSKPGFAEAMAS